MTVRPTALFLPPLLLALAGASALAAVPNLPPVAPASAAGSAKVAQTSVSPTPASDWAFELGAIGVFRPDYEGSNDYEVSPFPLVGVSWKDTISLSTRDGLQGKVRLGGGFSVTGGLGFWLGREEDDNDALRGLGDLSGNAIATLGLDYQWQRFQLGAKLAQDLGGDREGLTMTLRAGYALPVTDRFGLRLGASTTWASDDYMQAMFGIDAGQSARSGYRRYEAGAGFKDVKLSLDANYKLTGSVSLIGTASAGRLLGDAADSPIVDQAGSANQYSLGLGLMYKF